MTITKLASLTMYHIAEKIDEHIINIDGLQFDELVIYYCFSVIINGDNEGF